jgi:hypothetical protein
MCYCLKRLCSDNVREDASSSSSCMVAGVSGPTLGPVADWNWPKLYALFNWCWQWFYGAPPLLFIRIMRVDYMQRGGKAFALGHIVGSHDYFISLQSFKKVAKTNNWGPIRCLFANILPNVGSKRGSLSAHK